MAVLAVFKYTRDSCGVRVSLGFARGRPTNPARGIPGLLRSPGIPGPAWPHGGFPGHANRSRASALQRPGDGEIDPAVPQHRAGPDTGPVILIIEYADTAANGARTAFENATLEWRNLFEATPNSPETLLSVELVSEFTG